MKRVLANVDKPRFVQIAVAAHAHPGADDDDDLIVALDDEGRVWWRWHYSPDDPPWRRYPDEREVDE